MHYIVCRRNHVLHYLCFFTYGGVQRLLLWVCLVCLRLVYHVLSITYCCEFVLFVFVLCTMCCPTLIVVSLSCLSSSCVPCVVQHLLLWVCLVCLRLVYYVLSNTYCCEFVLFVFALCTMCCPTLIVVSLSCLSSSCVPCVVQHLLLWVCLVCLRLVYHVLSNTYCCEFVLFIFVLCTMCFQVVSNTYCCEFVLFVFVLCTLCFQVVSNTYCCEFVLFVFVLCTLCFQFLWIIHLWLPFRYSLTFMYSCQTYTIVYHPIT